MHDDDEGHYEDQFLSRRREFMPWEVKDADRVGQDAIREVLRRHLNAEISPDSYISPDALIFSKPFRLGDRSWIASGAIVRGNTSIGSDSTVNAYAHIAGKVQIGNGVRIASLASIYGFNHGFKRLAVPIYKQKSTSVGVQIGDGVWIGANAVILDGCTIGEHSIVSAGAVVTKSCEPYSIIGGNPARLIRSRKSSLNP
ncbi:acyltransferase [Salipiger bermudensis]|uniref:acyltransferase n=1 Tax=Salipiger bermudensis TaxID=344736 RepID=UPI001CD683DE|nr:acyltransferase [Salipiger bermudensis]MCA1288270.1 acyltransferase [Salipiger bermudensis]